MIQAIGKIIIYGVFTVWCIFSGYTLAENLIQLKVPILVGIFCILVGIFCILVLCTFNGLIGYYYNDLRKSEVTRHLIGITLLSLLLL